LPFAWLYRLRDNFLDGDDRCCVTLWLRLARFIRVRHMAIAFGFATTAAIPVAPVSVAPPAVPTTRRAALTAHFFGGFIGSRIGIHLCK
jgi:hypothetical protein